MIGTVLSNRYKLIAELGSGGMAWVYLAQDLVQERQVAVKILYPQHSHDLGFVQRFNREAKLSMTLSQSSPQQNVVQVLDYGADRDTHYLVMEYVPGEDLGRLLAREGPLPWQQALDIARQVALALEHAARVDIVHRDIKPSNIMVCPDATVKVLDFGIARVRSSPHLARSGFVGSPHYAAPEQATGQPVDIRADLYSLGVVLYRMLSGDLPFQGDTPWSVVNQHILAEPPDLSEKRPDLPVPVLQLVQRAMAKRAEDRFQTPAEFLDAIDAASTGRELPSESLAGPVTLSATALGAIYEQAQEAREAEKWQQAVDLLSQIIKVDPGYADVTEQLAEVGQQIQLSNLYRAVHRALEAGHWDRALAQIERIEEIDPSYQDIAELRALATNREKPARLGTSQASEFPTQIPLQESQAESRQGLVTVSEGSSAEAPVAEVPPAQPPASLHALRRRRVLWIAAILAILVLAGMAYWLLAEPEQQAGISQGFSTVTISTASQATMTPLPSTPSPSRIPSADAPSSTPSPPADQATATALISQTPSPLPTTPVAPTQTRTPTRTSIPSPTPTPTPTLTLSPAPGPVQFRPPTGVIAFPRFDSARGTYDVFACKVDGTDCRRVLEQASQPDFLPDGTRLVSHSWSPGDKGLIVFTASGQRIWQITNQLEAARPSVDYLGERYVYHSRAESDRQPRLFRTYNAETRPIVREASTVVGQSPSWTPDRQILYSGCLINSCGIIVMRADGTFPRQIIPGGSETNPEAAPNGRQITFMSRRDGNWEVYVAGINGERLRRLTQNPSNDGLPTWSPDGRYIAFVTDRNGPWAVWAMRPDGSDQRRLFDIGGPLDGQVRNTSPHEVHGWVEERISWAP